MAKKTRIESRHEEFIIELDHPEVVELVTLLTAQLANVTPVGRMGGSCPTINVTDRGVVMERIAFALCSSAREEAPLRKD